MSVNSCITSEIKNVITKAREGDRAKNHVGPLLSGTPEEDDEMRADSDTDTEDTKINIVNDNIGQLEDLGQEDNPEKKLIFNWKTALSCPPDHAATIEISGGGRPCLFRDLSGKSYLMYHNTSRHDNDVTVGIARVMEVEATEGDMPTPVPATELPSCVDFYVSPKAKKNAALIMTLTYPSADVRWEMTDADQKVVAGLMSVLKMLPDKLLIALFIHEEDCPDDGTFLVERVKLRLRGWIDEHYNGENPTEWLLEAHHNADHTKVELGHTPVGYSPYGEDTGRSLGATLTNVSSALVHLAYLLETGQKEVFEAEALNLIRHADKLLVVCEIYRSYAMKMWESINLRGEFDLSMSHIYQHRLQLRLEKNSGKLETEFWRIWNAQQPEPLRASPPYNDDPDTPTQPSSGPEQPEATQPTSAEEISAEMADASVESEPRKPEQRRRSPLRELHSFNLEAQPSQHQFKK